MHLTMKARHLTLLQALTLAHYEWYRGQLISIRRRQRAGWNGNHYELRTFIR